MAPSPKTVRARLRHACLVVCALALSGCVSSGVQRGALIGAASGLVAGGTIGLVASDPHLLGTENSPQRGHIALPEGGSIAAGMLVGTVVGAVVGAMVGHRRDEGYDAAQKVPQHGSTSGDPGASGQGQQARAPYLRGL